MRSAVYIAIVLWFIRRILRKDTPAAPVNSPEPDAGTLQRATPVDIERMLLDELRREVQMEIDRERLSNIVGRL